MLKETGFASSNIYGKNDAHIIKLNKENYNAPNLKKLLQDKKLTKFFTTQEQTYYL